MSIAVNLEVFRNVLTGIAEEMGVKLQRSAYSSNIKERRDYSCALFDRKGRLAAQAAHIPVHLGSMPILVGRILEKFSLEEGDLIIANDPFAGGTHLPDVTLVEPLFTGGKLWGLAAARAHHSDIGGAAPGSMPDSTSIYQEGIIIPPMLLRKKGELNRELLDLIVHNTRTPAERRGDFFAQMAALSAARERIKWLTELYGFEESLNLTEELIRYSERLTRTKIRELPRGRVSGEDYMEDDRRGKDTAIRVSLEIGEEEITVDFTGTDPETPGNTNAPLPVTMAAVYYVFRCLLGDHIPANAGCFTPIRVTAPEGCLVNARHACAVSAGNVETSQRIVDVLLLALSRLVPDRIPAASQGTMNNVAIGGTGHEGNFAYYETIGGGAGAGPESGGASAIHTHMTNTRNTPVEALETTYPFMITRYHVRKNSGGKGHYKGGDGIVREYRFLTRCEVTIMSERRHRQPWGLAGGCPGKIGENRFHNRQTGKTSILPGKVTLTAEEGDTITIETPGGAGFGTPEPEKKPNHR